MVESETQVKELITSFDEALHYWKKTIYEAQSIVNTVESSKVKNPLEELSKLAELVKAHTTKVGIIFNPERLESSYQAAHETLKKLVETMILVVAVVSQLKEASISKIFHEEIVNKTSQLIDSNLHLVQEITKHVSVGEDEEKSEKKDDKEGDLRLISVGQIWTNCDNIVSLIKGGEVGLLSVKINESIELINDGLGDFEEWTENPDDSDDDDPFGLDEFNSDLEDEEPPSDSKDGSIEEKKEKRTQEVIEYAKGLVQKIKLVKLLMFSVSKSLPSVTEFKAINRIYANQKNLVKIIDQLTLDLMLDKTVDDEIKEDVESLTKHCEDLLKITTGVNEGNEKKVSWCKTWKSKYDAI